MVAEASVARIYGYEKALYRLRLEAHHPAGQQARLGVSLRDLQVVRLRAGVPVVRTRQRARRPDRQRHRDAQGHGQPRAHLRRQQPLRLGRHRAGRRRRFVGHGGAARNGADHGEAAAAGDDRLCVVHGRGGGPARQPRVRAPGRRRQAVASSARSTTTWSGGPTISGSTTRSATRTPASATSSTRRRSSSRNLITYDALYYKGTDAAAYYEAFGDIVGGIGSYPVLSSPHYHQSHDVLENMNHQLITEVAKTTAATLALLASSPSRLTDLKVESLKAAPRPCRGSQARRKASPATSSRMARQRSPTRSKSA